ncbi:MAG TPA: hypoxanthine phosphoribosyltransferase, partial [Candidatus Nitrosocosmicus sp.]|nr:hypoxanthine phosphoribosyltransferase [Candidatus Nitrosocosmicus sp.]
KTVSEYKPGEVLISAEEIDGRLEEISEEINTKYKDQELVIIAIMKGSYILLADLTRKLHKKGLTNFIVDFIDIKSYGSSTESSREPQIIKDVEISLKDKNVLLVEDILDTGHTLNTVYQLIKNKFVSSIKTFALISKPERREVEFEAEYVGFVIPNIWIQGYGLDTDEKGRGEAGIIVGPVYY